MQSEVYKAMNVLVKLWVLVVRLWMCCVDASIDQLELLGASDSPHFGPNHPAAVMTPFEGHETREGQNGKPGNTAPRVIF